MIDATRHWLRRNKIFLDVIVPIIMGTASIIVAIAALNISSEQTKATALQAQIQRIQAMPRIRIAKESEFDSEKKYFVTESYVIHNDGGPIFDFNHKPFTIIELSRTRLREPPIRKHFALIGFYGSSFISSSQTGALVTGHGHLNNEKWGVIWHSLVQQLRDEPETSYELRLLKFLRLEFRDLLGEQHLEYYEIPHVGAGRQISSVEGKRLEDLYEGLSFRAFDINTLSLPQLLHAFETP